MPTVRTLLAFAALLLAAAAPAAAKPNSHATLDCSYCHNDTPRFGVDTRLTVNFWGGQGDEPALCLRCHAPEQNLHPVGVTPGPKCMDTVCPVNLPLGQSPAVKDLVVCTTCHFLHAADADFALLRGFPGSDRPRLFETWQDFCRECHGTNLEKRSPHAGDERACAFCHTARPAAGQPVTVTPAGRRLCEFCHGAVSSGHYAGVNPYKEPQTCSGCHDPHLGKGSPGRLKKGYFDGIRDEVTLNPHRRRTLCFACHADAAGTKLRAANVVELCLRCHADPRIPGMSHPMEAVPAGYAIPKGWPLSNNLITCLTCHQPGHPDEDRTQPHLLRGGKPGDRNAVCFICHRREQWAGKNPHTEVARQQKGCEFCHARKPDPAKDTAATVTFVADPNILCLACHGTSAHPAGVEHTMTLSTAATPVPKDLPLGRGGRITCATCHNPMTDAFATHLLRGAAGTAFCTRCHNL
jgi:hypothetical protein